MDHKHSLIPRIFFAFCLATVLTVTTRKIAQAGEWGFKCDGQPVVWVYGINENATINVIANGQNMGSFTTDGDGFGSLAFGEPGITYSVEFELVDQENRRVPIGDINCPATNPPAQLTTIVVNPANANLVVGEEKLFTATGKDQYDKAYPISNPVWSTSSGGTLSDCESNTCTYKATAAGNSTITCSQAGTTIQDTAEISTTNTPVLTTIVVTPPNANLVVGEEKLFTATGKDQYDKTYPISSPVWTTSSGGTLSDCESNTCTYTANQAGVFSLTVQISGMSAIAGIRVTDKSASSTPWMYILGGGVTLITGAAIYLWVRKRKLPEDR